MLAVGTTMSGTFPGCTSMLDAVLTQSPTSAAAATWAFTSVTVAPMSTSATPSPVATASISPSPSRSQGSTTAPAVPAPVGSYAMLQSADWSLRFRHCGFNLYGDSGYNVALSETYNWTILAGLDGTPGSVSFQPLNYPT
jgi:hypothetical protein